MLLDYALAVKDRHFIACKGNHLSLKHFFVIGIEMGLLKRLLTSLGGGSGKISVSK